jgi:4'-phosphopantetheinyl transferase
VQAASAELEALLHAEERARRDRFRLAADRHRALLGRGVLRLALGAWLGRDPASLVFQLGPHGKPALVEAGGAAPQFNLAHSGDLILLAVHRQRVVGVDLERDRQRLAWPAIARRYLGEAWLERLRRDHPDERDQRQAFLLEWCYLEARLKADGRGLRGLSSLGANGLDGLGDGATSAWAGTCWPLQLPAGYQGAAALLPVSGWAAVGLAGASTASGPIHIASP